MSKVVGKVLAVAALVVGIATGFGFLAIPAWVGAAITGAALLNAAAMGGGGGRSEQERQASQVTLQIGEAPRQAVLGETAVAGSLVDAFNYGGKHGTDWEVVILALADHRCAALTGFYVKDEYHAFTADGAVTGFNNQLMVWWRPGTEDQALPQVVLDEGPGWTANDNGAGVSFVVVAYKADQPEAKNPVWPGGRPRFLWVVKGAYCYIPRLDDTVGGDGDHRRDDPATWQWTDNLIDCRYNWVRGFYACDRVDEPDMLLVGRGLSAVEAPPANSFAAANLCDEVVDSEPRYRIDGVISATDKFIDVEERIAAACGGVVVQREGSVEVEPGQARTPVAWITDDDILVGSRVEYSDFLSEASSEWVNTVVPRFVDPAQRWADHSAPIRRDIDDVLADGGPREATLSLGLVKREKQAGRVGEMARRLGRLWRRGKLTLGPRFAEIEEGDWIVWTSARRFGGASKTFLVTAYTLDQKWQNTLQLREVNSSAYSDGAFIADQSAQDQGFGPDPIGAPAADAWTLSAALLEDGSAGISAIVIEGAVDDPAVRQVRFEYWRSDGVTAPAAVTAWTGAGTFGAGVTRREIASIAPTATYYAAVSYVVDGIPGDRRILGPVSAVKPRVVYDDDTPIEDLKPAEPGATNSADPDSSFGPSKSVGEALAEAAQARADIDAARADLDTARADIDAAVPRITTAETRLDTVDFSISTLRAIDLDAAAADRDRDRALGSLSEAVLRGLGEAHRTRTVLRDAGILVDPATGSVRIYGLDAQGDRLSTVEIGLAAAQSSILLRATTTYVDEQIILANFDPSQIADLTNIFARLGTAETEIDGLNAAVTSKASLVTVDALGAQLNTVESELDALTGTVATKASTTSVTDLATRVGTVESVLEATGDVTSLRIEIRQARYETEQNAEGLLRGLLNGYFTDQARLRGLAEIHSDLSARITQDVAAEASQRLTLAVRVGAAEAGIVNEQSARVAADAAATLRLTAAESAIVGLNSGLVTATARIATEETTRAAGDAANASAITALSGAVDGQAAAITALQQVDVTTGQSIARVRTDIRQGAIADEVGAEAQLRALLAGDQADKRYRGFLASVQEDLGTRITFTDGAVEAEASARRALEVRVGAAEAGLVTEQVTRASADASLATSITSLTASLGGVSAGLTAETQARVDADAALSASLVSLTATVGSNTAAISAEATTRATADSALSTRADALEARFAGLTGTVAANITSEATTRATADSALSVRVDTVEAFFVGFSGTVQAKITEEATARATADDALASRATALEARFVGLTGTVAANIATEATVRADADTALAATITSLTSTVNGNSAAITAEAVTRASADSALSASIGTLTTTVSGHTATLTTYGESINGLTARWGVTFDVDGRISGFTTQAGGSVTTTIFRTDKFKIETPEGVELFYTDETGTKMTNVEVDTIKAGAVGAISIAAGSVQRTGVTLLESDVTVSTSTGPVVVFESSITKLDASSMIEVLALLAASSPDDLQFTANLVLLITGGATLSRPFQVNLAFSESASAARAPLTPFAHFTGVPAGTHTVRVVVTNQEASTDLLTIKANSALKVAELRQGSL